MFVKTARITGSRTKNTKGKVVGKKRIRLSYTTTQSPLLELELGVLIQIEFEGWVGVTLVTEK